MAIVQKLPILAEYIVRFGITKGSRLFLQLFNASNKAFSVDYLDAAPYYLRRGTSDVGIFRSVILGAEYAHAPLPNIRTIVDAGANIGLSVRYFKQMYPDASVWAIEPDAGNRQLLAQNTQHLRQIRVLPYGLWDKPAYLKVVDEQKEGAVSFSVREVATAAEAQLEAITLHELMRTNGLEQLDLLKIDIESAEKQVFSAPDVAEWLPKVRHLIVETHDRYLPGCSRAVFDALQAYDFELDVKFDYLFFKNLRKRSTE